MTHISISIIGTGNMGQALADLAGKGGNTVELIGSSGVDKAVTSDIVVLAVPYPAVGQVIAQRGAQLAGKVVVDITNPLNFETFDSVTVPADSSAAAELPDSRAVKAFNTNFAGTLTTGTVGGQPTTVLLAGDDADTKALLAGVIMAAGLRAVNAGGLKRAREPAALGFLQLTLAAGEKTSWTGGFTLAQ
ncbi:NADPH-dependent F420 reductase [Streptomyces mirabilis]|uniref:NADPH-dependent F420 reductase n=1 Tax=Streptomyces mirabilis TaxID=68239 RepID=UPI003819EED5